MAITGLFTKNRPKIGSLYFDALLKESTELRTDVSEFPLETAATAHDNAVTRALAGVAASVGLAVYQGNQQTTRSQGLLEQLRTIQRNHETFDLIASKGASYKNCIITNTRTETEKDTEGGLIIAVNTGTSNAIMLDDTPNSMPAPRPANIALMYIVKTDQADNIKPDPTPTNIVVTPSSLNIGVGETQQFTAQVLPADLAPNFPVTWISTNTAAGTIDGYGLFRAVGPGNTDIIASVSTGLSIRVTVRVDILLTAIVLAAIPDQVAGNTYELVVTKTPSSVTETLSYASTDSAVASVTTDGRLMAAGEGTATISVTGGVSGVSASRVVNVTAAPVESDFLAI